MDEPAITDVKAGSAEPSRDFADALAGDAGADTIIKGRIDPVVAIASDGTSGNAGSSNRGPGSGKRGRHPGNCDCPRCTAKLTEPVPKEEKSRNIRASFIEKTLTAIHFGLVAVTKCPEFTLDDDDAKRLGEATAGVLAHYKVKMTAKQEAYALLMEAAAQVYPPMIVSIYVRKKMEAEARKPPNFSTVKRAAEEKPGATVTPIKPGGFNPADIRVPEGA